MVLRHLFLRMVKAAVCCQTAQTIFSLLVNQQLTHRMMQTSLRLRQQQSAGARRVLAHLAERTPPSCAVTTSLRPLHRIKTCSSGAPQTTSTTSSWQTGWNTGMPCGRLTLLGLASAMTSSGTPQQHSSPELLPQTSVNWAGLASARPAQLTTIFVSLADSRQTWGRLAGRTQPLPANTLP